MGERWVLLDDHACEQGQLYATVIRKTVHVSNIEHLQAGANLGQTR